MKKPAKKVKRPRKAPDKPDAAQEKMRQLVGMAHAGNVSAAWLHDIITEAGYCRKGDRITRADAQRYGKKFGELVERLVESVAAKDKELAASILEQARREVDSIT